MTPAAILADLAARGIACLVDESGSLRVSPAVAVTPELRSLLVEHKSALLELVAANDTETVQERRKQAVLKMLRAQPGITREWVADGDRDPVRVVLAARGVGTCELSIPADRWDEFKFLELLEKQEGTA